MGVSCSCRCRAKRFPANSEGGLAHRTGYRRLMTAIPRVFAALAESISD
jgi:hypothetical protein